MKPHTEPQLSPLPSAPDMQTSARRPLWEKPRETVPANRMGGDGACPSSRPSCLLAVWDIEVIAEAQAAILAPGAHEDGEATRMEESLSLMIAEPLA